jgi:hypothetical protein
MTWPEEYGNGNCGEGERADEGELESSGSVEGEHELDRTSEGEWEHDGTDEVEGPDETSVSRRKTALAPSHRRWPLRHPAR